MTAIFTSLTLAMACFVAGCTAYAAGVEAHDLPDALGISIREVRIGEKGRTGEYEADIHLVVCNSSDVAYCLLPTESEANLIVFHPAWDLEGGFAGATASIHASGWARLDVPSVIVRPKASAAMHLTVLLHRVPEASAEHVVFDMRCEPFFKARRYRGVMIYEREMKVGIKVTAKWDAKTHEWILQPVPGNDKSEGKASEAKEVNRVAAPDPP